MNCLTDFFQTVSVISIIWNCIAIQLLWRPSVMGPFQMIISAKILVSVLLDNSLLVTWNAWVSFISLWSGSTIRLDPACFPLRRSVDLKSAEAFLLHALGN